MVFSIALAVSYSTVAVSPQTSSIPLFFGLFYIPLLIITALLALLLVMAGSRLKWLAIAAIAPSVFFIGDFYRLPGNGETGNTQDHGISILSYNAGMFGSSSAGLSRKECAESISELIDRNGCEVACLQEVYLGKNENLHEIFKDYKYIHSHLFTLPSGNRFGNVTLSKYPFSGKGVISFDNSTNLSIYSDIAVNGEEIRIYNNHLESYNISFTSFIKKSTDRHKMTDEIMYMGDKLNKSTIKRAEQVKTILEHAENAGKKVADVLHIQHAEQGDERHVQGSRKRIRSDILLSLASFENRLPARSPRERSPLARHNKDRPFGPLPDNKQIKYMTIWQM